jgi:hypothetical protein
VAVVADKVFWGIDLDNKLSVKFVSRLDPEREPQCIKQQDNNENCNVTNVRIAGSDNLLAVLCNGVEKVSLWNLQDETWLDNLPIASVAPKKDFVLLDIAVSANLLAVTVSGKGTDKRFVQTLFWHLDTVQPSVSAPQFKGKVSVPKMYQPEVYMNGKFFGIMLACGTQFVYVERSKLFSGENNQVADLAEVADPQKPGSLWRQLKVCTSSCNELYLEPGNSNHIAVEDNDGSGLSLHISDLASGEGISHIVNEENGLHPVGWKAGNFFFLKRIDSGHTDEEKLQMVMFDPALDIGKGEIEIVDFAAPSLFPGLIIQSRGDFEIDTAMYDLDMISVDYYGLVLVSFMDPLFIAAFH